MICEIFFISTVYNVQLPCPRCNINCNFSLAYFHLQLADPEPQTYQEIKNIPSSVPSDDNTVFFHSHIEIYKQPSTLQHHHHTALKANMQPAARVTNPLLPRVTSTHMLKPLLCNKTVWCHLKKTHFSQNDCCKSLLELNSFMWA